jgi:catechol 2,3-dioxygenase-like lactoylglutathione lyase family enzyme
MNTLASIVYNVHNLDTAKAVQTALLGVGPHTETPYYVGFDVAGFEIALVPEAPEKTGTVPIAYISVPDLEAAISEVNAAGATLASAPKDVGGGTRTATVNDPDGNTSVSSHIRWHDESNKHLRYQNTVATDRRPDHRTRRLARQDSRQTPSAGNRG